MRTYFVLWMVYICVSSVYSKTSLTFVIDDTYSMTDDIAAVRLGADAIFETIRNSNSSQIENYVLATINDPECRLLAVTKDADFFKQRLADLEVTEPNWDCPELSMAGIEQGLRNSLPGSLVFVFTDASAKDAEKVESVKNIALDKQAQIVFVLTGECEDDQPYNREAFHILADATSGQVFHLYKDEIGVILDYVKRKVAAREVELFAKKFPPGYNTYNYSVDPHIQNSLMSCSGTCTNITLTSPDGEPTPHKVLGKTKTVMIVDIPKPKPGVHSGTVDSPSGVSIKITGSTSLDFHFGFSYSKPKDLGDTVITPVAGLTAYLAVKLIKENSSVVRMENAQILDMNNNLLFEIPLEQSGKDEDFFITKQFEVPHGVFKIAIVGHEDTSTIPIIRISPSGIGALEPSINDVRNIPPNVVIEGPSTVPFNSSAQLKCRVQAYPTPVIVWKDLKTGLQLPSKQSVTTELYQHLSVLSRDEITNNVEYKCLAQNVEGKDEANILVEVENFFNVLRHPQDTGVPFKGNGRFYCNASAFPAASTTWYKDKVNIKEHPLHGKRFHISDDGSKFTIMNMISEMSGKFECVLQNGYESKTFPFSVELILVKPELENSPQEITAPRGSNITLPCRVKKGDPKPKLKWFYEDLYSSRLIAEEEYLHLNNIDKGDAGTYQCIAENQAGKDAKRIHLIVEYPPVIAENVKKALKLSAGEQFILPCDVDGEPRPTVQWYHIDRYNRTTPIRNDANHYVFSSNSLRFTSSIEEVGTYVCNANNVYGSAKQSTSIDVFIPVTMRPPENTKIKNFVGRNIVLECEADGFPRPNITWYFYHKGDKSPWQKMRTSQDIYGFLKLPRVQAKDAGIYTCEASNSASSARITYEVQVLVPATIDRSATKPSYIAVVGDRAAILPCKAAGQPKPTIVWMKNGLNVSLATEWYDILDDGSLRVKYVDSGSQGLFQCVAYNDGGSAAISTTLELIEHPETNRATSIVNIEEGHTKEIECGIQHKFTDSVRWFKGDKQVSTGALLIWEANSAQSGTYTCRVSNTSFSGNAHTMVKIGKRPEFYFTDANIQLDIDYFDAGSDNYLNCRTRTRDSNYKFEWRHDGNILADIKGDFMRLTPATSVGTYQCIVTNNFGTTSRTFQVYTKDCFINSVLIKDNSPMLLTTTFEWPDFDLVVGNIRIQQGNAVLLVCSGGFKDDPNTWLYATCERGTTFRISNRTVKYPDIICRKSNEPIARPSSLPNMLDIGYKIDSTFLEVYKAGMKGKPITRHVFKRHSSTFASSTKYRIDPRMDDLYNCKEKCCFVRRQLVSAEDVPAGHAQMATDIRQNVVPFWSSCHTRNWDDIEMRVRYRVESKPDQPGLIVWNGGAEYQTWNNHTIPKYIWKVIQDPETRSSIAIIHLNIPYLSYEKPKCRNVNVRLRWLNTRQWRNTTRGYTYWCTLEDFENKFGYTGLFDSGFTKPMTI